MKLSDLIFDNHNANLGTEKGTKKNLYGLI
jgi:hypothetical protein